MNGLETKKAEDSAMQKAMLQLGYNCDSLLKLTIKLEERLSPITTPAAPDNDCCDAAEVEMRCPLVRSIEGQSATLDTAIYNLESLLQRIAV